MGLDMFLTKYPRYKNITPKQVCFISDYINWKNHPQAQNCTFKEWCGYNEYDVPLDAIEFYKSKMRTKYYMWDKEKKNPYKSFFTEIGYWRKANAVHQWFVENCQNGVDDCGSYQVDKSDIEDLLEICNTIKPSITLIEKEAEVVIGYNREGQIKEKRKIKYIEDSSICEELLPTQSGFFFGGTDYDEWYVQDIDETIEILEKVLTETDFENEIVFYQSSW